MSASTIERIVLIVLGGFLLVQAGRFTLARDGMMVVNRNAPAEVSDTILTWVAGAAILRGVVLVVRRVQRRV